MFCFLAFACCLPRVPVTMCGGVGLVQPFFLGGGAIECVKDVPFFWGGGLSSA